MSAIKDGRYPITLDKERHILFSLNAIDALQEKFGDFANLGEIMTGKDGIKDLRWLLTLILNEGADEKEEVLTEMQVGKLIHTGNLNDVKESLFKAFALASVGDETLEPPQEEVENMDEKNEKLSKGK